MVDIPIEAFAKWCSVCAVPLADHVSHIDEVTPITWKSMPCKRAAKLLDRVSNFLCSGLTFVPPDGTYRLLGSSQTIAEISQTLFPVLDGQAPPFSILGRWD